MLFRYVLSLDLIDPRFPTPRISPVPHYMLPLLLCGLLGFIPPTVRSKISRELSEKGVGSPPIKEFMAAAVFHSS
ncbi:hypothetical protein DL95DRAFT_392884 [Leptodontidium sp. 2 PMI_412]|nr:hypothetical protein DL95DRAFT_392884 [Leptodontidium sp. 2 PMI_412]